MKIKFTLLLAFFVLSVKITFSQYLNEKLPLQDAINYVAAAQDSNYKMLWGIAYKYFPDSDSLDISNELNKNEYIIYYDGMFKSPDKSGKMIQETLDNYDPTKVDYVSQSSGGSLLGTPLIDVIGTFMATRFREELTNSFLESFRERLEDEVYLGTIFSNAKLVLLNEDVFDHKAWLPSFRAALFEDLKLLPENLPVLIKKIMEKINISDNQKNKIDLILDLYDSSVKLVKHPTNNHEIILNFLKNAEGKVSSEKAKNAIILTNVLVSEFGSDGKWADVNQLKQLKNPEVFSTFVGFLILKNESSLKQIRIRYKDKNNQERDSTVHYFLMKERIVALKDVASFVSTLEKVITESKSKLDELTELKQSRMGEGEKLLFADFEPLVDLVFTGLESLLNTDLIQKTLDRDDKENLNNIVKYSTLVSDYSFKVDALISEKNYAQIIPVTLKLIEEIIPSETMGENVVLKEFLKYANLAVNLVNAESKEDLAEALENSALPVGSYRIKRNSHFSVSLNGYAGLSVGYEFLTESTIPDQSNWIFRFSAPVGIGLNWGLTSKKETRLSGIAPTYSKNYLNSSGAVYNTTNKVLTHHSLSAFISVIDVGAITAFRLTDNESAINDVQWKDVFSPGLRFVWGVGNTPLAFGVGAQYLPSLRSIAITDGVTTNNVQTNSLVFDATLTVDIPIFHFYTQTDKYKVKQDKEEKDVICFPDVTKTTVTYPTEKLNETQREENLQTKLSIKLHDTKNYDSALVLLAKQACYLLDTVLNSELFRAKLSELKLEQTYGLSNEAVYNRIMAGLEHSRITGEASVMDLYVRTINKEDDGERWVKNCDDTTIGKEGDNNGYIATCFDRLNDWEKNGKPYILAGHYMHEYLHNIGFVHKGKRLSKKQRSAVYQIGYLVQDLAKLVFERLGSKIPEEFYQRY